MTQRYASKTTVSSDRSKAEIEGILRRYGADQFMQGWEVSLGVVGFRINGFQVRMLLPLPNPEDFRHYERKSGYSTRQVERAPEAAQKAYEQAERQAWRALLLVIKAKLEANGPNLSDGHVDQGRPAGHSTGLITGKVPRSSQLHLPRLPGHRPLKAETAGLNPARATHMARAKPLP